MKEVYEDSLRLIFQHVSNFFGFGMVQTHRVILSKLLASYFLRKTIVNSLIVYMQSVHWHMKKKQEEEIR